MVRRNIIVHGRVQGVGFRGSTQHIASQYNLNGWAKNKTDGSVEIEVEGQADDVEHFIHEVKKGPSPFSKIDHIELSDEKNDEGYKKFRTL